MARKCQKSPSSGTAAAPQAERRAGGPAGCTAHKSSCRVQIDRARARLWVRDWGCGRGRTSRPVRPSASATATPPVPSFMRDIESRSSRLSELWSMSRARAACSVLMMTYAITINNHLNSETSFTPTYKVVLSRHLLISPSRAVL